MARGPLLSRAGLFDFQGGTIKHGATFRNLKASPQSTYQSKSGVQWQKYPPAATVEAERRIGTDKQARVSATSFGVAVPSPPTQDVPPDVIVANRDANIFTMILAVQVGAPLPHISVHVVQAPRIGWIFTNRSRSLKIWAFIIGAVGIIAVTVCQRAIQMVSKMIRCGGE